MSRYFPNAFKEYQPGALVKVSKEELELRIAKYLQSITRRSPSRYSLNGGLYVGVTGISYMLYHLSKNPLFGEKKAEYIDKAVEYLKPALESSTGEKNSFLLGDAGTYALAGALFKDVAGNTSKEFVNRYIRLFDNHLNAKSRDGVDEMFVGRAGYLAGALWLSRELQTLVLPQESMYKLCDAMVASGRKFAVKGAPCPLMYHYYNTMYLGAAHGVSFIMQMLISTPGYLQYNVEAAADIRTTISYLCDLQDEEGNWPSCLEEARLSHHKLVHWCHGAPGIIYLMAKAYLVYQEEKYLSACLKAGDLVWKKGLLRKGPGICHGVAGSGYTFLLLYRLTHNELHLYRAKMFADFVFTREFEKARCPDNPESLYEGTAGTLCFLSDLLSPDQAEFPFQDVFST